MGLGKVLLNSSTLPRNMQAIATNLFCWNVVDYFIPQNEYMAYSLAMETALLY